MATGQLSNVVRHIRRLLGGPGGSDPSDRELLGRFAAERDEEAFATLVQRHGSLVLGVCRRILGDDHDAEDAFQAVFLVLARKAGMVSWRESVGSWLYDAAYRTANQVRVRRSIRHKHERQAGAMHASNSTPEAGWHELRQVLDDELMHLPEKYRMPLLLCYLHGKTRDEAAEELGWSLNVLKGTLERGKEYLRQRLARRGLSLSAALLATELSANTVSAVPASLVTTTVKSATAGVVSASVDALVKGAIQAMFWTRVTRWMFVLLAFGLLGSSAGMILYHAGAATPVPEAKTPPEPGKSVEPVVKDGLAVLIAPTKPVFAFDEPQTFNITYTNRTAKAIRLYDIHYALSHWSLIDDKKGPWQSGPQQYRRREAAETATLEPDKLLELRVTMKHPYTWLGNRGEREARPEGLPPGKYRATAYIVFLADDLNQPPYWTGEISTKPVEFEIAEKPAGAKSSEPVVKDGLAITVRSRKSVFAANEAPAFDVIFENREGQAFKLSVGEFLYSCFLFDGTNREIRWRSAPVARLPEVTVLLKPGEPYIERIVLPGPYQVSKMVPDAPPPDIQARIAPGKYSLYGAISFKEGAAKDRIPYWTGSISTNPLEFEVAADKPGGAKASEPIVQDGLAVTLTLPKSVFTPDEKPSFQISYENRTGKAIRLLDLGYEVGPIKFTPVADNKAEWGAYPRGHLYNERPAVGLPPNAESGLRKAREPVSATVEPGKTTVSECAVAGEFSRPLPPLPGGQLRPVGAGAETRDALPPGKYLLRATIEFRAGKDNNDPSFWVGKITTNPVEFEIAEKPAPPKPQVKDAATGITVTVKDDNRTVFANDAAGKVIWFTDLTAVKGVVGEPVVRQLTLKDGKVTATYGKNASVVIDLKTGKVISISSD